MENKIEWRKIEGYENYSVSNKGDVRNNCTGRILKKQIQNCGYNVVSLSKNGRTKTFTVHRLVMNAFNPCPDESIYTDVNHIDYNKSNNSVDNLEWTTHRNNMRWGTCKDDITSIANEIRDAVIEILMKYTTENKSNNIANKLMHHTETSLIYAQRNKNNR